MALVACGRAPLPPEAMREAMQRASAWIAELCAGSDDADRLPCFMQEGADVDGFRLVLREMTGEPGDVFLMHPGTLHAGSLNCRQVPRMMLAQLINAAR